MIPGSMLTDRAPAAAISNGCVTHCVGPSQTASTTAWRHSSRRLECCCSTLWLRWARYETSSTCSQERRACEPGCHPRSLLLVDTCINEKPPPPSPCSSQHPVSTPSVPLPGSERRGWGGRRSRPSVYGRTKRAFISLTSVFSAMDGEASSVSIEWKDLNYTLTQKGCFKKAATKTILNGCSGFLPAGRLLAVMGPSGSGKTSFLNVLADRVPKNSGTNVTGEVFIGGTPRTQIGEFSRLASYVLQDDSLYPMLTVFETLFLAARLRLPANISLEDKRARVESLIDELGIRAARDVVIGDEKHKGVSGGERKRTNVGVEIIGDPSLIFLDEPTSGLDAFQALNVMQLLNSLASQRGRTVCVSIHQPRSSIYSLFDRLLLLASGSVIYSGDAAKAVDYFAKHGHACPVHYNPADYFIDLVSVDTSRSAVGGTAKASDDHIRIDALLEAAAAAQASGEFGGGGSGGSGGGGGGGGGSSSAAFAARAGVLKMSGGCACTGRYHSSLIEQSVLLYMRSLSSRLRDKPALIAPLFASTFFSLVFSALYSEMNLSQKSIQDRTGALFFVTINQAFGGVFSVANTFPLEKKIVDRERTSGAYAVLPYYLAKWLAEFPFAALGPMVFACVSYWIVGFVPEADNFLVFCGVIVMINMTAVSWGMLISSSVNSVEQATGFGPLVIIVFLLFGGFYVNTDNIPVWISWINEISFFKWGFQAMAINEYSVRAPRRPP